MSCYIDLNQAFSVTRANSTQYERPRFHSTRILSEYDFLYMLEGEWSIRMNGKNYTLLPDDLIIIPPGMFHEGVNRCLPMTRIMFFHAAATDLHLEERLVEVETLINCKHAPEIRQYMELIMQLFWASDDLKEDKMQAILKLIVCCLAGIAEKAAPDPERMVDRARNMVHNTPNRFIKLSEAAESLSVNPKKLSSAFQQETGLSFHQYQLDVKLNGARWQLMTSSDMKLREVALNFGFYDEFHFSRQFKKRFQMSPSEYRRRVLSGEGFPGEDGGAPGPV